MQVFVYQGSVKRGVTLQGGGDFFLEVVNPLLIDGRGRGQIDHLDFLSGGLFDRFEHGAFPAVDEENGLAASPGSAGSADAVDIGLAIKRNIVIDDMADALDVKAAGGDIGCHENVDFFGLQLIDGSQPLALLDITIQWGSRISESHQLLGEFYSLYFGSYENQNAVEGLGLENPAEGREFCRQTIGDEAALIDGLSGNGLGSYGDFYRFVQVFLGDIANALGHGSGKQSRLLVGREAARGSI